MDDEITIEVWVATDKVGSKTTDTFKVLRKDWESSTDEKKDDMCRDVMFSMIEWDYKAQ